jgi:hypothetical protein
LLYKRQSRIIVRDTENCAYIQISSAFAIALHFLPFSESNSGLHSGDKRTDGIARNKVLRVVHRMPGFGLCTYQSQGFQSDGIFLSQSPADRFQADNFPAQSFHCIQVAHTASSNRNFLLMLNSAVMTGSGVFAACRLARNRAASTVDNRATKDVPKYTFTNSVVENVLFATGIVGIGDASRLASKRNA